MRRPTQRDDLIIFVYGTLKRGYSNHERFCSGASSIREASVRGRIYELPSGFPGLVVPEDDIRAIGTADPASDAAQQKLSQTLPAPPPDGPMVSGEIIAFEDPEVRLPEIDRLEGFVPEEGSFYRRVLIPARSEKGVTLAWTYAIGSPSGVHLSGGRWPA